MSLCITFTMSQAQSYGPTYIGSNWQFMASRANVFIYARAIPGPDSETGASVYWKIENRNSKPCFIDGNFKVYGSPIKGSYGKDNDAGVVPMSKIDGSKTREFETPMEQVNVVKTIKMTLNSISFGSRSSKPVN